MGKKRSKKKTAQKTKTKPKKQRVDSCSVRIRPEFRQFLRFESVRRNVPVYRVLEQMAETAAKMEAFRASDFASRPMVQRFLEKLREEGSWRKPWAKFTKETDYGLGKFQRGRRNGES